MNFCPRCGQTLTTRYDGGRDRLACPDEGCGFIHFGDFSIGVGAVVFRDGRALLVQRGQEPNRGPWQLPGGYAEHDEGIVESIEREVLEETGIAATVRDAIGFRHSIGGSLLPYSGRSANIYVVFRLDAEPGEPSFDGDETTGVGFFSPDEIADMQRVQGLSRWAIELAREAAPDSGLQPQRDSPFGRRLPGWTLFGLRPPDDAGLGPSSPRRRHVDRRSRGWRAARPCGRLCPLVSRQPIVISRRNAQLGGIAAHC